MKALSPRHSGCAGAYSRRAKPIFDLIKHYVGQKPLHAGVIVRAV